MIQFPVVRHIEIENYNMYKNPTSSGISHCFNGGVHLIVGINGLGKTTLLNAIFRLLVGPTDIPKGDERPLGSMKHDLSDWRKNKFFSDRVDDYAVDATISADISFGDRVLKIKRKLSNLEVVSLSVDNEILDASQVTYEACAAELSGLLDFVDFFSVIKYLIFFLEDRSELIWDYRSQFEMFRILFYDKETSAKAVEHYDKAQAADSGYRNLNAALSKTRKKLDMLASPEFDKMKTELYAFEAQLRGVEDSQLAFHKEFEDCELDIESIRQSIARLKLKFDEEKFGIEDIHHKIYGCYYKDIDDVSKMIVLNALMNNNCYLCGSKSLSADIVKSVIENNVCPLCDAPHEKQESYENVVESIEVMEARLLKLKKKSIETLASLEKQQIALDKKIAEKNEIQDKIVITSNDRRKLTDIVRRLHQNIPEDSLDTVELTRQLKIADSELSNFETIRKRETESYHKILLEQKVMLKEKMGILRSKFEYYSKSLLAEKVMLRIDEDHRSVGQLGEKLPFPCFKVHMTSGVFVTSAQLRDAPEQVSESQREFIDLAFRLALIDLVTENRNSPSMIVMETPEASLDSMFMHEISLLFRKFSGMNNGKNLFLASTNLNQSAMISSLLGVTNSVRRKEFTSLELQLDLPGRDVIEEVDCISIEEREKHIINLLELSAPNMALRNHKEWYSKMYHDAVYPDL